VSLLLVLAAALLGASTVTGWWSLAESTSGGPTVTTTFLPGSMYQLSCSVSGCSGYRTGSLSYASGSLGAVGNLYEAVQVLLVLGALLGFVAGAVGLAGSFRAGFSRRRLSLCAFAAVLALLLAIAAVVAVPALQVSALDQDGGGIPPTAPSPLSSFWGSCSSSTGSDGICVSGSSGLTVSASWGPGIGWALAIAGALLLLFGLVALLRTRPVRRAVPGTGAYQRV